MPVKSPPKERPIIELFLSAYENDTWKTASLDWVEEKQDGAVEVIATRIDSTTLALEHTLIQPFVGEKFDSEKFIKAFSRIERNPDLILPERHLNLFIPVHAIPKGYDWEEVGEDLLAWLKQNHLGMLKEGDIDHVVPVGHSSKAGPLKLNITVQIMNLPGMAGNCLIARSGMPDNLSANVEKALRTKLPKLVATAANKRILMLERDKIALGDSRIYREVVALAPKFPNLSFVDEIWMAHTAILASEGWAYFTLMDGRGLVELLTFENGALKQRRDDRPDLGPPWREF